MSAFSPRNLMFDWLARATPGEINEWADIGLRHKSGVRPEDRLNRFINIARHFGYATRDESWGEFEKEFSIIITRMVIAERNLETLRAQPGLCEAVSSHCAYCGAEDVTNADVLLCREKPCRLSK